MAFQGKFSEGARNFMAKMAPDLPFLSPEDNVCAKTAFIDRMADTQNAEAWSIDIVGNLLENCGRVLYMASGITAPPLPEGVICIGYQPSSVVPAPPYLYWGFEYAPTFEMDDDNISNVAREPHRALVALGGALDDLPLRNVLTGLSLNTQIRDIDLLGSPVNTPLADDLPLGSHQRLHHHKNGDQISFLLKRSGLVIASFGNLGYEALAAGAPLCLVGQKLFQAEFADLLENRGLAVSAGLTGKIGPDEMARAIDKTLQKAETLCAAANRQIDGQGLRRIANIIVPIEGGIYAVN